MRMISIITSVFICLYLAGCGKGDGQRGPWEIPDSMALSPSDPPPPPPPPCVVENTIYPFLGKWEYCAYGDDTKITPHGYLEFLPDSLMVWFNYATEEYMGLSSKYYMEGVWYIQLNENKTDTLFYYTDGRSNTEGIISFTDPPYGREDIFVYKDFYVSDSSYLYFIDGRMYLRYCDSYSWMPIEPRIYRRIE
jgi:hypothetical protein